MANRSLVIALLGLLLAGEVAEARILVKQPRHFEFKIDANTPLQDLLPTPPAPTDAPPLWNGDLTKVREVTFGAPLYADGTIDTEKELAYTMAKINHLNLKKPDGFMEALIAQRPDLRGLPFRMGKDCRRTEDESKLFAVITAKIHLLRRVNASPPELAESDLREVFWKQMPRLIEQQFLPIRGEKKNAEVEPLIPGKAAFDQSDVERLSVAALTQIFMPASGEDHLGLAKCLATIRHADATVALARLILFSSEEDARAAAIEGLKKRDANEYAKVLLDGFRYPLPAVAQRAADALVKLDRKDLLPHLVSVLEQPDLRAPAKRVVPGGKEEIVVREMVRVNHHRNCILCHAPANTKDVPAGVLRVPATLPGEAGTSFNKGGSYGFGSSPDIFVRIDMTYLRQDFSMMMDIDDARPWHEKQRYDFFVQTRVLTAQESTAATKDFAGRPSPHHAAAIQALRGLSGDDAGTTASEWRTWLRKRNE